MSTYQGHMPVFNQTNGQTFTVGDTVRVSGFGWCDAKGVIQQMHPQSFQALVLRNGGANADRQPLHTHTQTR